MNISRPSIHPDFHIYKHSELSQTKDEALEPHFKKFFSIEIIMDDSWSMKIGHTTIEDMTNCVVLNSPYQLFSVKKYSNDTSTKGMTVFFTEQFFIPHKHQFEIQKDFPFFKLNSDPRYSLDENQQHKIGEILERMYGEIINPDDCSIEISRSYLLILLNTIKRFLIKPLMIEKRTRYDEITFQFEELILTGSGNLKTIADYAEKISITPAYLSECTKKSTGQPAKRILANYNLLRAKSLIRQTNMTIDEIAKELDFSETTNFIKFFKSMEEMTPNSYRNMPK